MSKTNSAKFTKNDMPDDLYDLIYNEETLEEVNKNLKRKEQNVQQ